MPRSNDELFSALKSVNPELAKLLGTQTTNQEYYSQVCAHQQCPPTVFRERWPRFVETYARSLPFLQSDFYGNLFESFIEAPILSTAEHLSPCVNPPNSNLLLDHLTYARVSRRDVLLSLPAGVVRMNNKTWPRRLYGPEEYKNLLSGSFRDACPLIVKGISYEEVERIITEVISKESSSFAKRLLSNLAQSWDQLDMYWQQVAWLNFCCYQIAAKAVGIANFKYLSVPYELLVSKMLQAELIGAAPMSWVLEALLDRPSQVYDDFAGAPNFFERNFKKGTFFFWYMNEKGENLPVVLENNQLIEPVSRFSCELRSEALGRALREQILIPSTGLAMLYLGFYLGLQLLGGGRQIFYLPRIRDRFLHAMSLSVSPPEREFLSKQSYSSHVSFYLGGESDFKSEFSSGLGLIADPHRFRSTYQKYIEYNRFKVVQESLSNQYQSK